MPAISKYSSMVYRLSQIYFDEQLAPYHIGCGQQFFLLHIYRHPGINQYELAYQDHYDKGTTARAVKNEPTGSVRLVAQWNRFMAVRLRKKIYQS